MKKLEFNSLKAPVAIAFLILIIITLTTNYYGSTDIADYSDTAKFFADKYAAKVRSSHSYLYGFIHAPFVYLFESFFIFKITSLIFLSLIIYSVYRISNKNKQTLWLALLSPVIWYMAPWINPIQLASLFLLWSWHFIRKYNKTLNIKHLLYSGILFGLGWAVWDTILFFGIFLAIPFLYNKKLSHAFYYVIFILIGLFPRLILDQFLFNFPFYSILKSTFGTLANTFGGIYSNGGHTPKTFINFLSIFLAIPLYFWILYKPNFFKQYKKSIIFLSLSVLLILMNPQIRYVLALAPIMIVLIGQNINPIQFKRQITFSVIIILLFTTPYLLQINYNIQGGSEFSSVLSNINQIKLSSTDTRKLIINDLDQISQEFPNQSFIVGNGPDTYQSLAHSYWKKDIKEFVSFQDYSLWLNKESILFEKTFSPIPNIQDRRQIFISGGIGKNENDKTDYASINYALTFEDNLDLDNFEFIKKYNALSLWQKS